MDPNVRRNRAMKLAEADGAPSPSRASAGIGRTSPLEDRENPAMKWRVCGSKLRATATAAKPAKYRRKTVQNGPKSLQHVRSFDKLTVPGCRKRFPGLD